MSIFHKYLQFSSQNSDSYGICWPRSAVEQYKTMVCQDVKVYVKVCQGLCKNIDCHWLQANSGPWIQVYCTCIPNLRRFTSIRKNKCEHSPTKCKFSLPQYSLEQFYTSCPYTVWPRKFGILILGNLQASHFFKHQGSQSKAWEKLLQYCVRVVTVPVRLHQTAESEQCWSYFAALMLRRAVFCLMVVFCSFDASRHQLICPIIMHTMSWMINLQYVLNLTTFPLVWII